MDCISCDFMWCTMVPLKIFVFNSFIVFDIIIVDVHTLGQLPSVVAYASRIKLIVPLRSDGSGQIYPPYFEMNFHYVTSDMYGTGATVEVGH